MLTAHVRFPAIDETPPTFSPFWLSRVLREDLHFEGVIFSDDLSMKAAHNGGNVVQRTRRALQAGCDMGLICNDHEKASRVASEFGSSEKANQARLASMYAKPGSHASSNIIDGLREKLSRHL
jgi:beta-N-acetylhexosaminidase